MKPRLRRMGDMMCDVSTLAKLLRADFDEGKLYWLDNPSDSPQRRAKYAGKEAFTSLDERGYKQGRISGKKLYAHRVIYALAYGSWPDEQVDHKNGNRSDNRLCNLRAATKSENGANRHVSRGTSRFIGVSWHSKSGKWVAYTQKDGRQHYLGLFGTEEAAATAYAKAALNLHGEFASAA